MKKKYTKDDLDNLNVDDYLASDSSDEGQGQYVSTCIVRSVHSRSLSRQVLFVYDLRLFHCQVKNCCFDILSMIK